MIAFQYNVTNHRIPEEPDGFSVRQRLVALLVAQGDFETAAKLKADSNVSEPQLNPKKGSHE